ncbi:hypothetical protein [Cyanothece sp. BG0011]|uniref:DUF6887 family protein n=1 Tax=Cyanothece sp. BG0011 TaxID=2082950 RepID=UPI000D1F0A67|nr:hypothetical protein [Cyanothece sp. BG0011]
MNHKPDFYQISPQELRQYVLSHREDNEALRIYMDRMRSEPGVTRVTGTNSDEDMQKLEDLLKQSSKKQN